MKNNQLNILETENLVLRKLAKTDFRSFCKIHQSPVIMKYFDGGPKTLEQARERFNEIIEHQEKYGFSYYSIFLKDTDEYAGQAGLYYNYDMSVNLCYAFLEEFQGKGYGTEAVVAVLKEGFEKFGFSEVTTMSSMKNQSSINLLEKVGGKMTREKTLFSGMNVLCYSITKNNFYDAISKLKQYTYREAIGCMLINNKGQIYTFQRSDFPDCWQCPEGGIDKNESELDATYREVYEEIGINKDKLKLITESHKTFKYTFDKGYTKYGYNGQKKKFFLFEFLGNENDFNYNITDEKPEFIGVKLVSKTELPNLVFYIKKDMYKEVIKEFDKYLK
ncbi:MAG TPA: GNAT family N-acetyltransferase [Rickettsiales bacterium]|nr:GNAT family N-acetyltransferase [Rickettsiales bacterium]